MIKLLHFSLPFLLACVFYVWFSPFYDDHQFIDVSKYGNP